jgi:hypothetical protein
MKIEPVTEAEYIKAAVDKKWLEIRDLLKTNGYLKLTVDDEKGTGSVEEKLQKLRSRLITSMRRLEVPVTTRIADEALWVRVGKFKRGEG